MKTDKYDFFFFGGIGILLIGVGMIHVPASFILGGIIFTAIGFYGGRGGD